MLRRAFGKIGLEPRLYSVCDGAEAIDYLAGKGRFADRREFPLPDLMLLDLKMPRRDGFDVLTWIRTQPAFRALRVIVLTGYPDSHAIEQAYELGAASFLQKPVDFVEFPHLIQSMQHFCISAPAAVASAVSPSAARAN